MAGFLDDLQNMLTGMMPGSLPGTAAAAPASSPQVVAPAPQSAGLVNYGATPTAQGIGGTVLARLRPTGAPGVANPLGMSPPPGGDAMGAAAAGMAAVDPTSSPFGAFAQGLAGGLAAREKANYQNADLGIRASQAGLENFKTALAISQTQAAMADRARAAGIISKLSGGQGQVAASDANAGASANPSQAGSAASTASMGGSDAGTSQPAPSALPVSSAGASGSGMGLMAGIAGLGGAAGQPPTFAAVQPVPASAVPPGSSGASAGGGVTAPAGGDGSPAAAPDAGQASAAPPQMVPHKVAADPNFWATVDPESNPAYLSLKAQAYDKAAAAVAGSAPDTAKVYSGIADSARNSMADIRAKGYVTLKSGSTALVPGFAASKGTLAATEAAAQEAAKSQFDLVPTQPTPGGPTLLMPRARILAAQGGGAGGGAPSSGASQATGALGGGSAAVGQPPQAGAPSQPGAASASAGAPSPSAGAPAPQPVSDPTVSRQPAFYGQAQEKIAGDENTALQQYQGRQVARQRLQDLQTLLEGYQTGPWAETRANLAAKAAQLNFPVPDSALQSASAFQQFQKDSMGELFDEVKGMGGRTLAASITGLQKTIPTADMQPSANAAIIGHGIGLLDYEDKHTQDYFSWKSQNPNATSTAPFELNWTKNNNPATFVDAARKNIAYAGQTIPPAGQRVVGQRYMTPSGPHVWQGNGWAKAAAPNG